MNCSTPPHKSELTEYLSHQETGFPKRKRKCTKAERQNKRRLPKPQHFTFTMGRRRTLPKWYKKKGGLPSAETITQDDCEWDDDEAVEPSSLSR